MKRDILGYVICTVIICSNVVMAQTILRVTLLPDSITQSTAVLKGYYISNDTGWNGSFDFGRTIKYELTGVVNQNNGKHYSTYNRIRNNDTVFINCLVENLVPQTSWHYRIKLSKFTPPNNIQEKYGNDQTFTTQLDSTAGGFVVPITISYPSTPEFRSNLRGFGLHTHATTCIDYTLGELEEPPIAPIGVSDLRFIPHRSSLGNCLGQGLFVDIREYRNPMQIDTFKIKFQSMGELYPIILEWGNPVNQYAGDVRLLFPLNGSIVNTDMKIQLKDTIPEEVNSLYIIAEKPINLLSSWFVEIFGNNVLVKGVYNPAGNSTEAWFELGPTTEYGMETVHQNIGSSKIPVTFESEITSLLHNTVYHCRIVTQNIYGISYGIDQIFETNSITGGLINEIPLPQKFSLSQNYPNPFNPITTLAFALPEQAIVSIKVYNMLGQQVATVLENEEFLDGRHEVTFDAANLTSGVYFYHFSAFRMGDDGEPTSQHFVETKKMILTK